MIPSLIVATGVRPAGEPSISPGGVSLDHTHWAPFPFSDDLVQSGDGTPAGPVKSPGANRIPNGSGYARRVGFLGFLLLFVLFTRAQGAPLATQSALSRFGGRELSFEPASDETTASRFLARGRNYEFVLSATQLHFALLKTTHTNAASRLGRDKRLSSGSGATVIAGMEFLKANPEARIQGEGELVGKVNYFIGSDPAVWRTCVPTFAKLRVRDLYPGVDLIYYGNQRELEYDFAIAPHTDPRTIRMHFAGIDRVVVDEQGQLIINIGGTELRQPQPVIYQPSGNSHLPVQGGYRCDAAGTVGFELGAFDPELPLIIDPRLEYSTYFGGNGGDLGLELKVDANGNIYFTGQTLSTQFPFPVSKNVFQPTFGGGAFNGDAFVAKVDSTGTNVLYLTYLGGAADDGGYDIAIDSSGNAYLAGFTESANFPTKNALFPRIKGILDPTTGLYPAEGFVTELNPDGSALVFSTYLGGSALDFTDGIAVDPAGNVYVTGATASRDFPIRNPLPGQATPSGGFSDAFVTKFSRGGTSIIFSTYLGGLATDEGQGIATDPFGFAYVTGYTASTNFPITFNASQPLLNLTNETGSFDAFLTKFSPDGALVFSTYLGGTYNDYGYRVTSDALGYAYVTGTAQSLDFPNTVTNVPGLVRTTPSTNFFVNYDVFLTKFSPSGQRVYSTIFGGTNDDVGWDVAVDSQGNAFIIGNTFSGDFPSTNTFDLLRATNSGGHDVFVTGLNSNASALFYSGYLGGSANDFGYGIAVDAESSAYIVGNTFSTNFPLTAARIQSTLYGSSDNFIAKIRLNEPVLSTSVTNNQLVIQWPASAPRYALESTETLNPPIVWTPVGLSPTLSQGAYVVSLGITNAEMIFRLRSP